MRTFLFFPLIFVSFNLKAQLLEKTHPCPYSYVFPWEFYGYNVLIQPLVRHDQKTEGLKKFEMNALFSFVEKELQKSYEDLLLKTLEKSFQAGRPDLKQLRAAVDILNGAPQAFQENLMEAVVISSMSHVVTDSEDLISMLKNRTFSQESLENIQEVSHILEKISNPNLFLNQFKNILNKIVEALSGDHSREELRHALITDVSGMLLEATGLLKERNFIFSKLLRLGSKENELRKNI